MAESNPPLLQSMAELLHHSGGTTAPHRDNRRSKAVVEEYQCELPLIDLRGLRSEDAAERRDCAAAISRAAAEWGFFQVVGHGVSLDLLRKMRREQVKLFGAPFKRKVAGGLLKDSYRWGTPTATTPNQFSWSEAFHVPLSKVSDDEACCYENDFCSFREVMKDYAAAMQGLARELATVLAMNLGHAKGIFEEICDGSDSYIRMNRYPPCTMSAEVFGLVPHTDSDFLTVLHQDGVGGLQLMKGSDWVAVKPNPDALIVNIGDLFQAWSNDVYKSVEHKVMTNAKVERYSIAYFMCPSYDSVIGSCTEPSLYRKFTFGEYKKQIQTDVKITGQKVGLPRFLRFGTTSLTKGAHRTNSLA